MKRSVAMKRMSLSDKRPNDVDRLRIEIELSRNVNHENVIHFETVCTDVKRIERKRKRESIRMHVVLAIVASPSLSLPIALIYPSISISNCMMLCFYASLSAGPNN